MSPSKRKRGAQPGNKNASKPNREAKAQSLPPTPIPENIDQLLNLEIQFLSEIMADLRATYHETAPEITFEEKLKMARAAAHVTMATLRVLKARQLHAASGQDEFSRALDRALDELNHEHKAKRAGEARSHPSPSGGLFGSLD